MRLHLSDVLVRAHQRGYSREEIQPCLIEHLGDGWYEVDVNHHAYPRRPKEGECRQERGLGDYIAAGLDAVGITKERVQALASTVGIKDCGCKGRQAAANALGAKYLGMSPGSSIDSQ